MIEEMPIRPWRDKYIPEEFDAIGKRGMRRLHRYGKASGKAMSGLIDLINKGFFTKKDTVLFIHTGGVAADFAYNEELSG